MRILFLFLILATCNGLLAQENTDEKVLDIVEEMPRFPGCEDEGLAAADLKSCSQNKMLEFVYQNISYPEAAREEGIEGTSVVRFVVQKDGSVADAKVVKEIGGGCGAEALRVVNLMNEKGVRWIPGKQKGEAVNVYFNLPVKYKLENDTPPPPPPPYFMAGQDTIYTEYDDLPVFGTEEGDLEKYMEALPYPAGVDSCVAGSMAMQFFVSYEGSVKVGELYDYNDLGFDYQFEAIKHLNATNYKWQPATRGGRPVSVYLPLRIDFRPADKKCKTVRENFEKAYALAAEAEAHYALDSIQLAVDKWTEALALSPGNTEFLLLRGQAYLELSKKDEACADLREARKVVPLADWVKQMMPLICN